MLAFFLIPLSLICWSISYQIHSKSLYFDAIHPIQHSTDPTKRSEDAMVVDDSPDNVLVFLQLTDIHISSHNKKGHIAHFKSFVENELPFINPEFVLATGDLTDAKDEKKMLSLQYKKGMLDLNRYKETRVMIEWMAYHAVLKSAGLLNRKGPGGIDYYYDLRGNHDCFNVNPNLNYFKEYSATKTEGYSFKVEVSCKCGHILIKLLN